MSLVCQNCCQNKVGLLGVNKTAIFFYFTVRKNNDKK